MPDPAFDMDFARQAAENYERHFVPAIGRPLAEDLVRAAELAPGEQVLDVACGTGVVARLAAVRVGTGGAVTGVDPNPAMLAVADGATPEGASIEWRRAPAEAIPLPDGTFDVVLCGMGIQFFGDQPAGLSEIRRVLRPGGRLVATLPGPMPPVFRILDEALNRHVGSEAASFVRLVFSLHEPDELRALATGAGFEKADARRAGRVLHLGRPGELLWRYVSSTPLAPAVAKLDEAARAALEEEFTGRCGDLVGEDGLTGEAGFTLLMARRGAR